MREQLQCHVCVPRKRFKSKTNLWHLFFGSSFADARHVRAHVQVHWHYTRCRRFRGLKKRATIPYKSVFISAAKFHRIGRPYFSSDRPNDRQTNEQQRKFCVFFCCCFVFFIPSGKIQRLSACVDAFRMEYRITNGESRAYFAIFVGVIWNEIIDCGVRRASRDRQNVRSQTREVDDELK